MIAVGRLDDSILANAVIGNEEADLIAVGRGMLRNPYWALEAASNLRKKQQFLNSILVDSKLDLSRN